uniref:WxL protein peptidoglycan domain-containing protein n=1 Tax=uncultured Allobacillus sp. TaxID=1638025 RepID=UPI002596CD8C|nr:DUF916 domain-containing protein [uncultured Allobacillus sp.]
MRRFLVIFSFLLLFTSLSVQAEEHKQSISVVPLVNEELQIDDSNSYIYYDLSTVDQDEIPSSFLIQNNTDEKLTVISTVRNALTDSKGNISLYANQETNLAAFTDERYMLENYIEDLQKEIVLEANETKEVDFTIDIPKKLKGKVIGGLGFVVDKEKEQKSEGVSIELKEGFVFGVWLKMSELKEMNELEIEEVDVKRKGSKFSIYATVKNSNSDIFRDVSIPYEIISKEEDKQIVQDELKLLQISPKNVLKYEIPLKVVKEGMYALKIDNQSFDFEIDKQEVEKATDNVNEDDEDVVVIEDQSIPFYVYIIVGLLIAVILFLLLKRKKDNEETDQTTDKKE